MGSVPMRGRDRGEDPGAPAARARRAAGLLVLRHAGAVILQFPSLSCIVATCTASLARALDVLPDPRMQPVQVMPGRCLFVVGAMHYREGDLGAYDELVLAVPIAFGARSMPLLETVRDLFSQAFSAYVWRMPVTTETSRRAGADWAGFPKSVADIRFAADEREARCTLMEDGAPSVALRCTPDAQDGDRLLQLRAHTVKDGTVLVSPFVLRQTRYRDHVLRDAAQLQLGEGPLARELKRLELGDHPLASHWCEQAQGTLHPPHPAAGEAPHGLR